MTSFEELRQAKAHGFNLTILMVQAFLRDHGPTPVGLIARACEVSIRSVERSLVALKAKGLVPVQKTTKESHDHVFHGSNLKGTATTTAVSDDKAVVVEHADPLARQLLAFEVLPWCVDALLAKVDREVLARQLTFHAHRLASGFVFKGHPARYLFRACLNDYQAPGDFHATAHKQREGLPTTREPARAGAQPVVAPLAPMTREGALTIIRLGMRSKLPRMREEALRLAATWQVDVAALPGCG
jgi:DNA-binding transcriptional ArsR family regulator